MFYGGIVYVPVTTEKTSRAGTVFCYSGMFVPYNNLSGQLAAQRMVLSGSADCKYSVRADILFSKYAYDAPNGA